MQTNTAMETHVSPILKTLSQEDSMLENPVLGRLVEEVKNSYMTMGYDRVHNRHNRGGN